MATKLRSWWQKARKPLEVFGIIVICMLMIALLVVIVLAYIFKVDVAGLRGKTLWDWLQLLIVPLVLAVGALLFNLATTRTEQKIAAQRYEQDQQIALDKQHEDLLQAYLDRMSDLLLKESLRTSPSEEVCNVARVRTITVLTQLDGKRVGYVFSFLREAGLMSTTSNSSVVSLKDADLGSVNWSLAHLSKANLSHADLTWANLSHANLSGANLYGANLLFANLTWEDLGHANLSGANLSFTDLSDADLNEADLSGADLSGAHLNRADLSDADLSGTNLSDADLNEANIGLVDLSGADLSGAKVTSEQLDQAWSLEGATMPDGSKHLTENLTGG